MRAVLALAGVEARRLVRHPVTVLVAVLYTGWWASSALVERDQPAAVLQEADIDTQFGVALVFGAGALLVTHLAATRWHRYPAGGVFDTLAMPRAQRAAALLMALVPLAVVATGTAVLRVAYLAALPTTVGTLSIAEIATAPAVVLLCGAVAVLVANWVRGVATGPILVLLLLVVTVLATGGSAVWWLAPARMRLVPNSGPLPASLIGRPSTWHVVYVAALAVAVGAVSVALAARRDADVKTPSGETPGGETPGGETPGGESPGSGGFGRTVRVAPAVVAFVLAGSAGAAQFGAPDQAVRQRRAQDTSRPAAHQTCRNLDGITYCAFPEFVGWIPGWNALTRAVLRRAPASARSRVTALRQHVQVIDGGLLPPPPVADWADDDRAHSTLTAVPVGTGWGSPATDLTLAARVADRLVTGDTPATETNHVTCGGRAVVTLWLAGQASARTRRWLAGARERTTPRGTVVIHEGSSWPGPVFQPADSAVVADLLRLPDDEVAARVNTHWVELTRPGTSTARAAALLGVPAPAPSGQEWCR